MVEASGGTVDEASYLELTFIFISTNNMTDKTKTRWIINITTGHREHEKAVFLLLIGMLQ